MRTFVKIVLIIFSMSILTACKSKNGSLEDLEFYILRFNKDNGELTKEEDPIFTGADISYYEWDTHTIEFTDDFLASRKMEESDDSFLMGGSQLLGVFYPDQFAVYLNGEELYRGFMKPQAFISFMPSGPMITDASEHSLIINTTENDKDTRDNSKLYEFLEDHDLLK